MQSPLTIYLPWPPKELSPNTRLHWSKLARAKRVYRAVCASESASQGVCSTTALKARISLVFTQPTKRGYDLDNLVARMKSGLDGLADTLGLDDRHWALSIERADAPKPGGFVEVTIELG